MRKKKCLIDREKVLKFEAGSREFAKVLRPLEQFVQKMKGQNSFWDQNTFFTCPWRFPMSHQLEQF